MPKVTIVNKDDKVIGAVERSDVTEGGHIVRIARVVVFNQSGQIYIQQRAKRSSDLAGVWDLSATGHVDEGESYEEAAHRETEEEIGLSGLSFKQIGPIFYFENSRDDGFLNKRFNALYRGITDQEPVINPDEVAQGRWIDQAELQSWIQRSPEEFTPGCLKAFALLKEYQDA